MNRLATKLGSLDLRTPLMTASGTSGSGNELRVLESSREIGDALGAFVTKGVSLSPRSGNPQARIVEARTGVLNSIGLENPGAASFVRNELLALSRTVDSKVIVNIAADTVEEFGELASFLCANDSSSRIDGFEINVSCPNVEQGGMAFCLRRGAVEQVVKTVVEATTGGRLVITKLSPNVSDITEIAREAVSGGTGALSLINTVRGMAISVERRRPVLGNLTGGLSGPAIKPIGLACVYECYRRIPECERREVPLIGIGGISSWRDAMEYVLAGASAVGIGTAWFIEPTVFTTIRAGLSDHLVRERTTISDLVGAAHSLDVR